MTNSTSDRRADINSVSDPGLRSILEGVANRMSDPGYEEARAAWQADQRAQAIRNAAANCKIPGLARKVLDDEWTETDSYKRLRVGLGRALKQDKHFLLAWGVKGTGKTVACCRLMMEMVVSEKTNVTSGRFMSSLELGESSDAEEIRELTRIGKASGILILDDCGQETRNENRIVNVLTARHNDGALTMITMNCPPKKLHYDDRIIDRLIERGVEVECVKVVRPGVKK